MPIVWLGLADWREGGGDLLIHPPPPHFPFPFPPHALQISSLLTLEEIWGKGDKLSPVDEAASVSLGPVSFSLIQ